MGDVAFREDERGCGVGAVLIERRKETNLTWRGLAVRCLGVRLSLGLGVVQALG